MLNEAAYNSSSSPVAIPTLTVLSPTISAVSVSPVTVNDGSTFNVNYTFAVAGTSRVVECVDASCSSIVSTLATGTYGTISKIIDPTTFSFGSGAKYLGIEVTDTKGIVSLFTNTTTPSVASVYRNARPANGSV